MMWAPWQKAKTRMDSSVSPDPTWPKRITPTCRTARKKPFGRVFLGNDPHPPSRSGLAIAIEVRINRSGHRCDVQTAAEEFGDAFRLGRRAGDQFVVSDFERRE